MSSDSRFYRPRNGVVVEVCLGERGWEIWLHTETAGTYQFKRHLVDSKFGSIEEAITAAHDRKFSSEKAEQLMQGIDVPLDRWWNSFPLQEIVKHRGPGR